MSAKIASEIGTILLAIFMAFLVWVAAVREEDPFLTQNYPSRIPVKVTAPANNLVLLNPDDLPNDIQIEIQAPQSVWQNLSPGKIRAWVDLSAYPAGVHTVPIQVEVTDKNATIESKNPTEVDLELEPLTTKHLPITAWITDDPPLGYFNRQPVSNPISVTVKGSAEAVDQVSQVLARIQLNNSKETVVQNVSLQAYNENDVIVRNVSLDPPTSVITVPIEQRFGYKDVSVKADVTGQPAPGYWVNNVSVEPPTLTLIGGPSVLSNVSGFIETLEVDISGATGDIEKRVPLNLPPGASIVADETDSERSVLVKVGISAQTGGRTIPVDITVQGVSQDLSWTAAPESVQVILSGPLPVLQNLKQGDISVVFDLFGLQSGVHRLQPEIIAPDNIEVSTIIPDSVEFTLQPLTRITATSTPQPTATLNARPTPTLIITSTVSAPTNQNTATDTITSVQKSDLFQSISPTLSLTVAQKLTATKILTSKKK